MKTLTRQKPWEEIKEMLNGVDKVYLVGCGTCATMCHTGGKAEVVEMKAKLEAAGKTVTGWMVVPTTCDELTKYALEENAPAVQAADGILAMVCAFGVQTISLYSDRLPYPALDTLFVGLEDEPGHFIEVCMQCASCVLGRAAGLCPLVRCAKTLLNGPCGGSVGGKCEVSPNIPCVWQDIVDRLQAAGRLDRLEEISPVHDWSVSNSGGPRRLGLEEVCPAYGKLEATR
ncbi:MAG: methylenetetrahydrofolate reductase C-terminal domain-containing protein [Chloroflexi bacterium]|nr:methylenetetrahydrofolate reductase C-terminal domain-containing protein [Chloroflexota bacterium]